MLPYSRSVSLPLRPEDRRVQVHVPAASQVGGEAGAEFEQRRDAAVVVTRPVVGLEMPVMMRRRWTYPTVVPDEAEHRAAGTANETSFSAQNSLRRGNLSW